MVNAKNKVLKNLVDSSNGLHLTVYIKFDGNIFNFRRKLNALLGKARNHLSGVISSDQVNKFLAPVEALGLDIHVLNQLRGNIAIFRKRGFFRFMSLPTEIEEVSVVADSFHIKPLLKWAQLDQEFLLVGLTYEGATLYKGSQSEFRRIDEAIYPDSLKHHSFDEGFVSLRDKRHHRRDLQRTMEWLAQWVEELTKNSNTTVFVAGNGDLVRAFVKNYNSEKLYPETLATHFTPAKAIEMNKSIKSILRLDSQARVAASIGEFEAAKNMNATRVNIFQIAKEALKGNVKKLIVAEDNSVFGKLDRFSGSISINLVDLDHEDDCLLDDLAQTVLIKGGEVIVAKKNEIPYGKIIMAILSDEPREVESKNYRLNEVAI